jgi:hypothetical protein
MQISALRTSIVLGILKNFQIEPNAIIHYDGLEGFISDCGLKTVAGSSAVGHPRWGVHS